MAHWMGPQDYDGHPSGHPKYPSGDPHLRPLVRRPQLEDERRHSWNGRDDYEAESDFDAVDDVEHERSENRSRRAKTRMASRLQVPSPPRIRQKAHPPVTVEVTSDSWPLASDLDPQYRDDIETHELRFGDDQPRSRHKIRDSASRKQRTQRPSPPPQRRSEPWISSGPEDPNSTFSRPGRISPPYPWSNNRNSPTIPPLFEQSIPGASAYPERVSHKRRSSPVRRRERLETEEASPILVPSSNRPRSSSAVPLPSRNEDNVISAFTTRKTRRPQSRRKDRNASLEVPYPPMPGGFPYPSDTVTPEDSRSDVLPFRSDKRSPSRTTGSVSGVGSFSGVLGVRTYQYDPLGEMEFRLVKILPARMSTIKCEILHASLENSPVYTAISYAWGDADDTRKIQLEGASVPVAVSLYGALDALRQKKDPVLVWVDALSIDQQNKEERAQQVQLMTSIYSKAAAVAIWLGQEADDSDLAMTWLHDIANEADSPSKIQKRIASPASRTPFAAIVALFERDYWRRLWVVQEVFNGRQIVVHCGPSDLPWSTFKTASHIFWRHKADLDYYYARGFSQDNDQVASLHNFTYSQALVYQGPSSLPDVSSLTGLGEDSLLEVLRACRRKLTADARDKVFGVLGVLPEEIRDEFPVDYNLSLKEVYINVVDYLLSTTESLDVICESFHFPLHTSSVNLPSWVPDWSYIPESTALGYSYTFSSSGTTPVTFRLLDERRKIEISAIYLDIISTHGIAVGTLCTLADYLMAFLHWRALFLGTLGGSRQDLESQQPFCHTLCLNQVPTGWENPRKWLKACYYVFSSLLEERLPYLTKDSQLNRHIDVDAGIPPEDRRRFLQEHFGSRMMGRCLLLTESGLIGMGSGFMAAGDIIVVPLGCSTPVILRPEGSRGEYRFVGDVYVHGYMDGEAIQHWRSGERELRKFVIH